jgi:hypothetical protein
MPTAIWRSARRGPQTSSAAHRIPGMATRRVLSKLIFDQSQGKEFGRGRGNPITTRRNGSSP